MAARRFTAPRRLCERCGGRGWVLPPPGGDWPVLCPQCRGLLREPTLCALARAIDEERETLYRLRDMRLGRKVSTRLLGKLVEWLGR